LSWKFIINVLFIPKSGKCNIRFHLRFPNFNKKVHHTCKSNKLIMTEVQILLTLDIQYSHDFLWNDFIWLWCYSKMNCKRLKFSPDFHVIISHTWYNFQNILTLFVLFIDISKFQMLLVFFFSNFVIFLFLVKTQNAWIFDARFIILHYNSNLNLKY